MSDRIQKCIMLLISANFPNQKDRVENEAGDDQREEYDPDDEKHDLARVQQDPTDIQRDGKPRKAYPECKEKDGCFSPTHFSILNVKQHSAKTNKANASF